VKRAGPQLYLAKYDFPNILSTTISNGNKIQNARTEMYFKYKIHHSISNICNFKYSQHWLTLGHFRSINSKGQSTGCVCCVTYRRWFLKVCFLFIRKSHKYWV